MSYWWWTPRTSRWDWRCHPCIRISFRLKGQFLNSLMERKDWTLLLVRRWRTRMRLACLQCSLYLAKATSLIYCRKRVSWKLCTLACRQRRDHDLSNCIGWWGDENGGTAIVKKHDRAVFSGQRCKIPVGESANLMDISDYGQLSWWWRGGSSCFGLEAVRRAIW